MHQTIQRYLDDDLLVMASCVVLQGTDVIDFKLWGHQDRELGTPLTEDSIFRIYSNTKPVTSVAAMMLWQEGSFDLDDPIAKYLPELNDLRVLKAGASEASETEPLAQAPTVRQLMCHNAGFSYGIFAESVVDPLYLGAGIMSPDSTLEAMIDKLAGIPLAYQPGTRWQYSVSTDVLARLIEVWSGQRFDEFLKERVLAPLAMADTDFHVPQDKRDRFCGNYAPVDMLDPMKPGLNKPEDSVLGSYLTPKSFLSGGGGLVSTITDYTQFIRMIMGEGEIDGVRLLEPETLAMMHMNQLPDGVGVQLPNWYMPDTVFGLGFAIKTAPAEGEPEAAVDEYHWGGLAGTHSWVSPRANLAGIIFTQRLPGFWHPFSHDFKRLVYEAVEL